MSNIMESTTTNFDQFGGFHQRVHTMRKTHDELYTGKQNTKLSPILNAVTRLFLAIIYPIAITIDFLVGLNLSLLNLVTFRSINELDEISQAALSNVKALIAAPALQLIQILNPTYNPCPNKPEGYFSQVQNGLFHQLLSAKLIVAADSLGNKDSFLTRELGARITWIATLGISAVARLVDLAIGVVFLALCFGTLGQFDRVNNIALSGLQSTALLSDSLTIITMIANTHTEDTEE